MPKDICIAVIGHQDFDKSIPAEYRFIRRTSDTGLTLDFEDVYKFRAPSYVWSEYAAWFENSKLINGSDISGLFHYRCALNLLPFSLPTFPFALMAKFLSLQAKAMTKQDNFLYVGLPNELSTSVWEQFEDAHPESISILQEACRLYDSEVASLGLSAEDRLKTMSFYYPRNIFITDTSFSEKWLKTSFSIAKKLDQVFEETPQNRWGGFVLERLFTLFVEDFRQNDKLTFKTFQQTYFVGFVTWIKIKLLKINFIQKLRRKLLAKS